MTAVAPARRSAEMASSVELVTLSDEARGYWDNRRAAATRRVYDAAWRDFQNFCARTGARALPAAPATVAAYLTFGARDRAVATLEVRLAAIRDAHLGAGQPFEGRHPLIQGVFDGIRRARGVAGRPKAALERDALAALAATCGDDLKGVRDRALLLVGFGAALRRSELVALEVRDLEWTRAGLLLTIRRSKTDQQGRSQAVAVPYGRDPALCPVRALAAWLDRAGLGDGPVFRPLTKGGAVGAGALGDRTVALVVKAAARAAGLDPALYAGHSLRAGLATSAADEGAELSAIADHLRHRKLDTTRRYVRRADAFRNNAAGFVL